MHPAVLGMVVDHVVRDKSQGGAAAVVAVADTHTDPEMGFVDDEVVHAVGRAEVPGSSFVPYLGSPYL